MVIQCRNVDFYLKPYPPRFCLIGDHFISGDAAAAKVHQTNFASWKKLNIPVLLSAGTMV
jgi:hypothetical protein